MSYAAQNAGLKVIDGSYLEFLQRPHGAGSRAWPGHISARAAGYSIAKSHRYAIVPGWHTPHRGALEARTRCGDSGEARLFQHGDRHVDPGWRSRHRVRP